MKIKGLPKILLIVLVVGALLGGGGYAARSVYRSMRQTRLVKQAEDFMAKSNQKKALLCLQRAIRYNPKDIKACRLMAQLADIDRSPLALLWRSRVVELNPKSVEDRLALARTALNVGNYASATNALAGVDETGKKTVMYQNLAGTAASTANQFSEAEAHFLEASRLDPTNAAVRLNLAVVRLHQTNATALAQARATLNQLCADPVFRKQSLRELAIDAARNQQTNAALSFFNQLVKETNSAFSDRLLRLELLRGMQNADFKPSLAALQREATNSPATLSQMAMWLMAKTSSTNTLEWLQSLPMDMQTNQPGAMLSAECHIMMNRWHDLQTFLAKQNWVEKQNRVDLEFVRHAFLTWAFRGQGLSAAAKSEWETAVSGAQGNRESLIMLLRLAGQWNWQKEGEELLWTIVNKYPNEKWAFQTLSQVLFASGQTRSLLMLFSQQAKTNPSDLGIKNNLAFSALLLDAKEMNPHELAREVYEKSPTNATFASTYAYSLYVQKKNQEALKILEQLKPQELESGSIPLYYAMALKAKGDAAQAKKYLDMAAKARLLPEEQKLFEKVKTGM